MAKNSPGLEGLLTYPAQMEEQRVARYFRKPSDHHAFLQLGAIVREVAEGTASAPAADS
jgi:hypothetical protein